VTVQPIFSRAGTVPGTGSVQAHWPVANTQFLAGAGGVVWPTAGTFGNFVIYINVAPGTAKSRTFAFTNITTAASVTLVISDAEVTERDIVNTLSVSVGDVLQVTHVGAGTPAAITECYILAEFTSTNDGESGYTMGHAAGNGALSGSGGPYYVEGPFASTTWTTSTPPAPENIVAVAGNVTSMSVRSSTTPGASKSWDFWLVKNGVLQDGAGGTVNTHVNTGNVTTGVTGTFTLPVSPGDRLSMKATGVSAPASSRIQAGITLTATADGECQISCSHGSSASTSVVNYGWAVTAATAGWDATETNRDEPMFVGSFTLAAMYVLLGAAPGAGNSWQFDMRRDAATPGGALSVLISDSATTGSDVTGSLALDDGHLWGIKSTPTSGPAIGSTPQFAWRIAAPTVTTTGMAFSPFVGSVVNVGAGSSGPFTG